MIGIIFTAALSLANANPWTVLSESVIEAPAQEMGIRQLPLDLMVEKGSRWANPATLKATLNKSSGILRRCGVVIGEVRTQLIEFNPELLQSMRTHSPYKGPKELNLIQDVIRPLERPLGFLYGSTSVDSVASAFNRTSVERLSYGTIDARPLVETFHITEQWLDWRRVPGAVASYDTFAHELVHLMGDVGHIPVFGNLMSEHDGRGSKTGALTADQCAKVAEYPFINDL